MVELCIHIANVFYLVSFLLRDILWLRALTCGGLVLGIVFFSCQQTPMYGPAVWHIVFLLINGFMIWRLVAERRQLTLTEEQERVAQSAFENLSRDELLTLLTRAMSANPGRLRDIRKTCQAQLTPEEKALRDIAFSRLSRKELLNLLTRKLWSSIKKVNPVRWRRRRRPPTADAPGQSGAGGQTADPGQSAAARRGDSARTWAAVDVRRIRERCDFAEAGAAGGRARAVAAAGTRRVVPRPLGPARERAAPAAPRAELGRASALPLPSRGSAAAYEEKLFAFLNGREYVKLGWLRDKGIRDTGPFIQGKYYGTHPAVRVYYSPGVMRWLIGGRVGKIPDGEMIIKEQYAAPAARHSGLDGRATVGRRWSRGR